MAHRCAEMLYEHICEELGERALLHNFVNPLIVPIPLHTKRLRARGFNQAELIAREFVALDTSFSVCTDALVRIKDTESQTKMKNREERIKNVTGCFKVSSPEKIKERNIILIDDVYTTGATLNEARGTLLHAGAREVLACTIAH
ncbi:MAG: phosphoribosyltransferase family protein [bacterium]|nr:phosphoribosyltransferase family protein [bacterium]